MVGVAGKSKGCHTCRKRKIKCDCSRPICKQCARGSWTCEGYERTIVFHNQYLSTYSGRSISTQQQDNARCENSSGTSSSTYNNVTLPNRGGEILSPSDFRSFTHGVNMALYDQILSCFVSFCLPTGASEEVPLAWVSSLYQRSLKSKTLSLAAAGVGYGWMGHEDHCPDALLQGHGLYCSALSSVTDLLHNTSYKEELLPTIMMLLLYELFEFGTQSTAGWQAHASGIETILQLYGPQNFINILDFQMFHFYRTIGILRSLTTRKSTFLSKPEWINTPWSLGKKNSYHQFLDLAAEAPSLLEQVDKISASDTCNDECLDSVHNELVCRVLQLIQRIRVWEAYKSPRLADGPPHTFSSSGSSMIATDQLQHRTHRYPSKNPCTTGVDFDELQSARLMLFSWAVMLTLYTSIHDNPHLPTCLKNKECSTTFIPTSADLLASEAETLADKITLWADFCCQNAWQSFGPAIGIFSVETAMKWYQVRLKAQLPSSLEKFAQDQLQRCHTLLEHLTYCDRNNDFGDGDSATTLQMSNNF